MFIYDLFQIVSDHIFYVGPTPQLG